MRKNNIRDAEVLRTLGVDPEKFYLGKLCLRRHEYKDTGMTLKRLNRCCPECHNLKTKESKSRISPERRSEINRKSYFKRRDAANQKHKEWLQRNKEHCSAYRKQRRLKHLEEEKAAFREWKRSEAGKDFFHRYNERRRVVRQGAYKERISKAQIREIKELFNNECAYCGRPADGMDHFVAVMNGGAEAPWNLVPCCKHCNPSKKTQDAYEWYSRQEFFCFSRWQKILSHVQIPAATQH